jgi:hypothetical protein
MTRPMLDSATRSVTRLGEKIEELVVPPVLQLPQRNPELRRQTPQNYKMNMQSSSKVFSWWMKKERKTASLLIPVSTQTETSPHT